MHDTYYADDQGNIFTDDKDLCDGKDADSSRRCTPATQTSRVIVTGTKNEQSQTIIVKVRREICFRKRLRY